MRKNKSEKLDYESVSDPKPSNSIFSVRYVFVIFALLLGFGTGFLLWGKGPEIPPQKPSQSEMDPNAESISEIVNIIREVDLPENYTLPISYGDIGPQLIAAGAIDLDRFVQVFQNGEQPLSEEQLAILTEGSSSAIEINRENSYFLLNLFWAFALTNANDILLDGPMMTYGIEEIGRFASTGGWTLGTKSPIELYSSENIVELSQGQQARLLDVASRVFRPCCDNPTHFPDCNHGMAMLGILEIMASTGSSIDEMFEAAKYINAFWFPQKTFEIAMYLNIAEGKSFDEIDATRLVSRNFFSSSGYRLVHQQLAANNMLEFLSSGGISCGI